MRGITRRASERLVFHLAGLGPRTRARKYRLGATLKIFTSQGACPAKTSPTSVHQQFSRLWGSSAIVGVVKVNSLMRSNGALLRGNSIALVAILLTLVSVLFVSLVSANPKRPLSAAKATVQVIAPQAKHLTLAGREFTRVDEYFDPATRVWSVFFADDPKHSESFANEVILNFFGSAPPPTAEQVAAALVAFRPGMKTINHFKAREEPGGDWSYYVISVAHVKGEANFVNVMRVVSWGHSSVTITIGHRLKPGSDLQDSVIQARRWLGSIEGEELQEAASALRLGEGWETYLKKLR